MRKPSVTSIDVARRAGVSQSTVSRTFAPAPGAARVSEDVRQRVLLAAEELGYRPNALARSLITQRSRMVAVLFSYLDNAFYATALEQLCLALQKSGYHAVVFMMPDTLADVDRTVSELLEYQVDGVITASVELSSAVCARCIAQQVPVVMFNRIQDDDRLSGVTTDNVAGGRLAARHLIGIGARRIGMIGGWSGASTNRDREFGFRSELEARGASLAAYESGQFDLGATEIATRQMFARPDHPDAVFITNDYMAIRALDVMRFDLGLRVPQDVAVIGFDDVPMAAQPSYDLTTVRQPIPQMVATTVRILFDQIESRTREPEHVILGARLVERGSTRR